MSTLMVLLVILVILACCGGGFWGYRSGWWGRGPYSRGPYPGPYGGVPFANGSATPPSSGYVEGTQVPSNGPYWNPIYVVLGVIIVIFLIIILYGFVGGHVLG